MGHTTVFYGVGFYSWDGGGNTSSSAVIKLYTYMDYAVGDLLVENKDAWDPKVPESWRDYGTGIITNIDVKKELATIYWFEVGISSFYKICNVRKYLTPISQPRA